MELLVPVARMKRLAAGGESRLVTRSAPHVGKQLLPGNHLAIVGNALPRHSQGLSVEDDIGKRLRIDLGCCCGSLREQSKLTRRQGFFRVHGRRDAHVVDVGSSRLPAHRGFGCLPTKPPCDLLVGIQEVHPPRNAVAVTIVRVGDPHQLRHRHRFEQTKADQVWRSSRPQCRCIHDSPVCRLLEDVARS